MLPAPNGYQTMPFFSIIIPTYNSEKCIAACCLSVIHQTYQDYEIVIQDGLSTDSTLQELGKIKQEFPLVKLSIASKKDSGIYDAMNNAVMRASGDWLLFLGSDDQLYNQSVLMSASDRLQDARAQMVYGNAHLTGNSGWAEDSVIYDGPFSLEKLFSKNICHQAIFYNKAVFKEIGYFNTKYDVCADWDFNFRCFAGTQVQYTDLVIASFAGGGLSNTSEDAFRKESIIHLKNYFKISYFDPLFKTYSWVFLHHAITAYKSNSFFRSLRYLLLSFFHAGDKVLLMKIVLRKVLKW